MYLQKPHVLVEDLPGIIKPYDLGDIIETTYLGGVPNITFKVTTTRGEFAVRIANNGYTSVEHLKIEVDLLQYLAKNGFQQSPRLVIGSDGKFIQHWRGFRVIVTKFIPGIPGDRIEISTALCDDVGCSVAKLMRYLSKYKKDIPTSESFFARTERMLDIFPISAEKIGWQIDVGRIISEWHLALMKFEDASETINFSVLHSDVWPPNLICASDKILGIVDFDDWCYGPSIIELCGPLVEFPMTGNHINQDLGVALFRGYFAEGGLISSLEEQLIVYGMEMASISWLACNALHAVPFDESETYLRKILYWSVVSQREEFASSILACIRSAAELSR